MDGFFKSILRIKNQQAGIFEKIDVLFG